MITRKGTQAKAQPLLKGLDANKTYLTVKEFAKKTNIAESEIQSAIRFGALAAQIFPVRGAHKFRIEEGVAKRFARRFYAKMI